MQKKSFQTLLYSSAGIVLMLASLIAVNVITSGLRARVDLTREKAYTLSEGTKAILRKLETPVKIRFYCSQSEAATPETVFLKSYARKVEDLLAEYRQIAGKNLVIEKYDPQPDSDAEDSARLDGLEPQPLPGAEKFYLGLAVKQMDEVQSLPFLAPNREQLLEYDITRAIARAVKPEKPVVGIMSALPIFGTPSNPMMMQMGQQGAEPWALVGELTGDFDIKRVEMNADKIDEAIKVLLVIYPKDISDTAQYAIDQFILRGGKLVAFLDAQCLADKGQQNSMMGNLGGGGASLDKLLKAWGLQFDTSKVVADLEYQLQGRDGYLPAYLGLSGDAINNDDVATSQIDSVWLPLSGAFTGTPAPGLKETVLLQSSKESQLVEGFMASMSSEGVTKDFKASGINYKLAIRLAGKFKTAFPEGKPEEKKDEAKPEDGKKSDDKAAAKKPDASLKETQGENSVVLVGDADMLFDPFTLRRVDSPLGAFVTAMNANLAFAQNLVDQLAGDANLIGVRSRNITSRPFTRIRDLEARAEASGEAKIKLLQDNLAETQSKLNELQQQKKDKDQRFILSPEQRTELENFRKQEAQVSKELKQVQKDLRKEVVSLETKVKWINILAMPLAVTLTGIVIAMVKRKKTSAK